MANVYKQVAAGLRPADTNEATLYQPGASTQFIGVVRVCNQDTVVRTYRIAHADADEAAAAGEWVAYDVNLYPGDPPHEYSFNMSNPEAIRVKASVADKISFTIEGLEIT